MEDSTQLDWLRRCEPNESFYYQDDSRKWLPVKFHSFDNYGQKVRFYCGSRAQSYEAEAKNVNRFSRHSPDLDYNREQHNIFLKKCHKKWPCLIQTTHMDTPMVAKYLRTDKKVQQSKFQCVAPYTDVLNFQKCEDNELDHNFWIHHREIKQVEPIDPLALKSDSHPNSDLYKHLISSHLAHTIFTFDRTRRDRKSMGSLRYVLFNQASRLTLKQQVQMTINYKMLADACRQIHFGFYKVFSETYGFADALFLDPSIIPELTPEIRPRTSPHSSVGKLRTTSRSDPRHEADKQESDAVRSIKHSPMKKAFFPGEAADRPRSVSPDDRARFSNGPEQRPRSPSPIYDRHESEPTHSRKYSPRKKPFFPGRASSPNDVNRTGSLSPNDHNRFVNNRESPINDRFPRRRRSISPRNDQEIRRRGSPSPGKDSPSQRSRNYQEGAGPSPVHHRRKWSSSPEPNDYDYQSRSPIRKHPVRFRANEFTQFQSAVKPCLERNGHLIAGENFDMWSAIINAGERLLSELDRTNPFHEEAI